MREIIEAKLISTAGQNFHLLALEPADSSGTIGDLQPVVAMVQHGQFRAVVGGERALRLLKRPAARGGSLRDDHGGLL